MSVTWHTVLVRKLCHWALVSWLLTVVSSELHSSDRQEKKDQRPSSNSGPMLYRRVSAMRAIDPSRDPPSPIALRAIGDVEFTTYYCTYWHIVLVHKLFTHSGLALSRRHTHSLSLPSLWPTSYTRTKWQPILKATFPLWEHADLQPQFPLPPCIHSNFIIIWFYYAILIHVEELSE